MELGLYEAVVGGSHLFEWEEFFTYVSERRSILLLLLDRISNSNENIFFVDLILAYEIIGRVCVSKSPPEEIINIILQIDKNQWYPGMKLLAGQLYEPEQDSRIIFDALKERPNLFGGIHLTNDTWCNCGGICCNFFLLT